MAYSTVSSPTTSEPGAVTGYYSRKTSEILYKYGPGPRVHFHVGIFDPAHPLPDCQDRGVLRRRLVSAQEAATDYAARSWLALADEDTHDAAIAIESSGYMDRERLFAVMARALCPGGWFGVQEHFPVSVRSRDFLDSYYKTRLGTPEEYRKAAQAAGFELAASQDITGRVADFWRHSLAWITAELACGTSPIPRERLTESAATHRQLHRLWCDQAVRTQLLLFRLRCRG